MQLDPARPFSTQIEPLVGTSFERIVSAVFSLQGYFTFRNLKIMIKKQVAAEIDVLASAMTPLHELRIAIECKGQTPSFGDIRKFATIRRLLNYSPLELMTYGANDIRPEHEELANSLKVTLRKKEELNKMILPILWGNEDQRDDRIKRVNRLLAVYTINDFLYGEAEKVTDQAAKQDLARYRRYIHQELWSIDDPFKQLANSLDTSKNEFRAFTDKIAKYHNSTALDQLNNPTILCVQSAMLFEVMHRVINLYAIIRACIHSKYSIGRNDIASLPHPLLRNILNNMSDNTDTINHFLNFVVSWIFVWGGFILKREESREYELLAADNTIPKELAIDFVKRIKDIYSRGLNLINNNRPDILFLKWVPAPYRALGILHRRSLDPHYNTINAFAQDAHNLIILDQCLASIGGRGGLRF